MKAAQSGRGPTTARGRSYPPRHCAYCSAEIPKISAATGVHYFKSQYSELATCGDPACQKLAHDNTFTAEQQAEADSAMDRFLRGGL